MYFTTLISAAELATILNTPELRLFDCRFYLNEPEKGRSAYLESHLPMAQYADLNQDLAGEITASSGRHPLPGKTRFIQKLQDWGIDENSQIVVYDDAGGAIAARLWWMLQWAGLKHVALLDAGIDAWIDSGGALTTAVPNYIPSTITPDFDDSMHITTEQLQSELATDSLRLTDARAAARYRGEVESIDKLAGHVPGAINLPFDENLNSNGTFLDSKQLARLHQPQLIEKNLVSMCGSGVTACHNILARKHAGLGMGKLYVGSWSEWIRDSHRPMATG